MQIPAEPAHCTLSASAVPAKQTYPPAATLDKVSKVYGTFPALRNLTFTIPSNAITVILGENGAGKSTLLRLLAGLAAPTHGILNVLGRPADQNRGRVAYMSHAPMLYDELSARENLDYFASLHKLPDACDCAASPEMALRAVSLDPHLPRPVAQYSQGMRQRASLARVLQTDPTLLLLDEPFSNLDVVSAQHIVDLLADFITWPHPAADGGIGRTIVLTTHQAHLAAPIANLTLHMRQGMLVA